MFEQCGFLHAVLSKGLRHEVVLPVSTGRKRLLEGLVNDDREIMNAGGESQGWS